MKKILTILAMMLLVLAIAGCGQNDEATNESATDKAAGSATEAAGDAQEVAETHDCDGGCGMKDVPMDQLTEVHGKYYCAGCAKKADEDHGHDHG